MVSYYETKRRGVWKWLLKKNKLIAIEGSEHDDIDSLKKRNDEFWNNVYNFESGSLPKSDSYKKAVKIFELTKVRYEFWNEFYKNFKDGTSTNLFNDLFIRGFARVLLQASVICNEEQKIKLKEQREDIKAIVEKLLKAEKEELKKQIEALKTNGKPFISPGL